MDENDVAVIGGGPAGYVAAIHAAHLGAKVALVEKDRLGGTCLNQGCIPTKALVRSVEMLLESRRASEFGIETDDIKVNFKNIMGRKSLIVDHLRKGIEQLIGANKIDLYQGVGRILSPNLLKVGDQEIATKKIVIATGSGFLTLPIPGLEPSLHIDLPSF